MLESVLPQISNWSIRLLAGTLSFSQPPSGQEKFKWSSSSSEFLPDITALLLTSVWDSVCFLRQFYWISWEINHLITLGFPFVKANLITPSLMQVSLTVFWLNTDQSSAAQTMHKVKIHSSHQRLRFVSLIVLLNNASLPLTLLQISLLMTSSFNQLLFLCPTPAAYLCGPTGPPGS